MTVFFGRKMATGILLVESCFVLKYISQLLPSDLFGIPK